MPRSPLRPFLTALALAGAMLALPARSAPDALAVARDARDRLVRITREGRPFGEADRAWLARLQETLGREEATVPDPERPGETRTVDTRLAVERLNDLPGSAAILRDTLVALVQASERPVPVLELGALRLPVADVGIRSRLRASYDTPSFRALYEYARQQGAFALRVDPRTGLVSTSGVSSAENPEMADRQWVTDTVRTGELERRIDPDGWRRALQTLALFYTNRTEQAAFDRAIARPATYRDGGPEEGVAHLFFPQTLERDPAWFNNKRLESHGLALRAFADTLAAGLARGERWGFPKADAVDDRILRAVANLAAYLVALDYPSAPSAGNWEETPFPGGLTWDTEAVRSGLASIRDFMANPAWDGNAEVVAVRRRLLAQPYGGLLGRTAELDRWIAAGRDRVRRTRLAESPGHREMDASLVFLASSTVTLADDEDLDVARSLELLETLEKALVRDHGMIRYAPFTLVLRDGRKVLSPDSYLALNYFLAADRDGRLNLEWKRVLDEFGSKDASDPSVFAARAALSTPDREAEWFMVSDLARGYVRQASRLVDLMASGSSTPARQAALARAWAGANRAMNRAYARLTGTPGGAKANGAQAPACAVPEAWQYVSRLGDGGADLRGGGSAGPQSGGSAAAAALPGVHTPLAWGQVSLWGASEEFLALLGRMEASGIRPPGP